LNKVIGDPIFSKRFRDGKSTAEPSAEAFAGVIKRDAAQRAELVKPPSRSSNDE
jgi:hypothetical protein